MALLDPRLPDYDLDDWAALPFADRWRTQCGTWAEQGFGTPWPIYLLYLAKAGLFVLGWLLFAGSTEGFGGIANVGEWWHEPVAFQKAVLWALLFEGLGLGCGSGPLTGRYLPPIVAFTHFLRPGTTRNPPWPGRNPLALGYRRSIVDAAMYAAVLGLLVRALAADDVTTGMLVPLVVLIPLLGLRDKTVFLIFRSEHYWLTLVVFVLASSTGELLAGSKAIQLAIWWGAATSKLNRHFPAVVAVMVSNAPLVPQRLGRKVFRDAPHDMRPSGVASTLAHGGTVIEYLFPLVLVLSDGGWPTTVALVVMFSFHTFIMTAVALGVPTEWNVFFLYSMFVLFGHHADVRLVGDLTDPLLIVVLVTSLVAVPALGNVRPDLVSFLPAMRYYAGNWATSAWLFRKGTFATLDDHVTKTSQTTDRQLDRFYDERTRRFLMGKVSTFRTLHLHGRLYATLLPRAIADLDADLEDYDWIDGELVAGLVLGWNFGDGHLHDDALLAAIREQCDLGPGDLRVVQIEGQPMGKPWWPWRIVDVVGGELERGEAPVTAFLDQQPWEANPDPAALGIRS